MTYILSSTAEFTYSAISSSTTAVANYHYTVDTSSSAVTLTLPARSGITAGTIIRVKLGTAGNDLTIDGNSSETIDGVASIVLESPHAGVTLVCNGTSWFVL